MRTIRIIRWFKGLGHSHGFGVQSPFAYNFIREICFCRKRGKKEEIIKYITNKVDALTVDFKDVSDNRVVVMRDVYADKGKYAQWKNMMDDSNIDMTFDFLYVCVAIKREGLSKKNYIINY